MTSQKTALHLTFFIGWSLNLITTYYILVHPEDIIIK